MSSYVINQYMCLCGPSVMSLREDSQREDYSNGIQKGRINQLLNIKGGLNTKKRSEFGNPFFVHSSFIDDQNPEKHTLL